MEDPDDIIFSTKIMKIDFLLLKIIYDPLSLVRVVPTPLVLLHLGLSSQEEEKALIKSGHVVPELPKLDQGDHISFFTPNEKLIFVQKF